MIKSLTCSLWSTLLEFKVQLPANLLDSSRQFVYKLQQTLCKRTMRPNAIPRKFAHQRNIYAKQRVYGEK